MPCLVCVHQSYLHAISGVCTPELPSCHVWCVYTGATFMPCLVCVHQSYLHAMSGVCTPELPSCHVWCVYTRATFMPCLVCVHQSYLHAMSGVDVMRHTCSLSILPLTALHRGFQGSRSIHRVPRQRYH